MITEYLARHPTALADGDSGAPDPVARLIEDLIASGVEGLRGPRCLDAASRSRFPGGCLAAGSATRCRHRRRPQEMCARCGTIAPRERARTATRSAHAAIQLTYVPPVDRCGVCGVNRTTERRSGSAASAPSSRTPAARRAGCRPRSRPTGADPRARTARRERASRAGMRRADGRARPQGPAAVRALLPATGRYLRPLRPRPRDRPPRRRRRPGSVRDLLDRTDRQVRELREGPPVSR